MRARARDSFHAMKRHVVIGLIACLTAAAPALADTYPVSGKWGVSASTDKGPVDCSKLRVITFNGDQRTDSGGGVPAFRNRFVHPDNATRFRVEDEFTTGQIANAHVDYTLHQVDGDHLDMNLERGGLLKLRKCK
jgi:hypothetical protein